MTKVVGYVCVCVCVCVCMCVFLASLTKRDKISDVMFSSLGNKTFQIKEKMLANYANFLTVLNWKPVKQCT